MEDRDANRLLGPQREQLRPGQRARAQLVQVEVPIAQVQQLRPQLILVAVGVLLDQAVRLQRPQKPVHGPLGEVEPDRDLADAEAPGAAAQGLQNADGAVDGLNHESFIVEWCSTL